MSATAIEEAPGGRLKVDFKRMRGGDAPPPSTADRSLSAVAGNQTAVLKLAEGTNTEFSCLALFPLDQRPEVTAYAHQFVDGPLALDHNHTPDMRAQLTELLSLGGQSLEGVNALVREILNALGRDDIPDEVRTFMTELNRSVDKFRGRYSPSRERGAEYYAKLRDFLGDIFGRGAGFFQAMIRDAMSVQRQLDAVSGHIIEAQAELIQSVAFTDGLYARNVEAIDQLIGEIAVLEEIRRLIYERARAIELLESDPERKKKEELKAVLAEIVNLFDVRINEFHQRLFVAWTTNPQVRNIGIMTRGMAQRLAMLVNLTIPVLKLTIAQWALALKAQKAGDLVTDIIGVHNEAMQQFAEAMGTTFGKVMQILETPSTSVETIFKLTESLDRQTKEGIAALDYGDRERARVRGAINVAVAAQAQSSDELARAMLRAVEAANQPLALPRPPEREDVADVITPELESQALELEQARQAT